MSLASGIRSFLTRKPNAEGVTGALSKPSNADWKPGFEELKFELAAMTLGEAQNFGKINSFRLANTAGNMQELWKYMKPDLDKEIERRAKVRHDNPNATQEDIAAASPKPANAVQQVQPSEKVGNTEKVAAAAYAASEGTFTQRLEKEHLAQEQSHRR